MRRFALLFVILASFWFDQALAQSQPPSPGGPWPFGFVPTQGQWQAAWAAKQDFLGGLPCLTIGCTLSGKLTLAASTLGAAGLNCGAGSTPTTPINGDLWCTTSGVFAQINGSTIPLGSGSGFTVPQGGTGQTSFTANLPLIGNGAGAIAQGTRSGNTTVFGTISGATANGACVSFDASGNLQNAGVGACGGTGGSGTVSSSSANNLAVYTAATTVGGVTTGNNGVLITSGGGVPSISSTLPTAVQTAITQLGTIGTGVWNGTVVGGTYGGTGVNNGANTITVGGNFATIGAAITLTGVGATNVTLPTSGNIPNSNGTSGGIPYYNTTTTIQSSGALTANLPVIGGGAGAAPSVGTRQGNTTTFLTYSGSAPAATNNCAAFDGTGATANIKDSGVSCGLAGAPVLLATLTASGGSVTDIGNCGTGGSAGCFTNSYARYKVDIINLVATLGSPNNNQTGCQIQVYNSGGSYQATGYVTSYAVDGSAFAQSNNVTTYIPCWPIGASSGNNTMLAPGISGSFTIDNPSASAKAQLAGNWTVNAGGASPIVHVMQTGGYWNTSAIIVGFRICPGTIAGTCAGTWASGTIKVYGLP